MFADQRRTSDRGAAEEETAGVAVAHNMDRGNIMLASQDGGDLLHPVPRPIEHDHLGSLGNSGRNDGLILNATVDKDDRASCRSQFDRRCRECLQHGVDIIR